MIDGAHVLTPGVLRLGMTALSTYVAACSSWQRNSGTWAGVSRVRVDRGPRPGGRGPSLQPSSGQSTATACSRSDTSSAIVTGSTASSRAIAVCSAYSPRAGWRVRRQLLDAGGGYANLDLYERVGSCWA